MCSCRGPHAGFVHVECLVAMAESKGEWHDDEYVKTLDECAQCRQGFRGAVFVALTRAAWLRFADRAETDKWRQLALENLGAALTNADRIDEALLVSEAYAATIRRQFGADHLETIQVEREVAIT